MATATIDGLEVSYVVKGSGPALLMLAPGGFDAARALRQGARAGGSGEARPRGHIILARSGGGAVGVRARARHALRRRLPGAGRGAIPRARGGERPDALRSRHAAGRRARGDHGHEGARADPARRRSGPRRIRRVLPARAAAGAGVLAGDAARTDAGPRAREDRGVRTRAQVTRQTFPPAHPFLAGAKRGRTMADVWTVVA